MSHGERLTALHAIVADADDTARGWVAAVLQRLGLVAVEAASGEEALELAERALPALVVLDVGLPGSSAYEVCRVLREAHGDQLPIVFVSEYRIEPADEVAGLLLGADEYFAKPLRADLFLARLRRLLIRGKPGERSRRTESRARERSVLTPREHDVLALLVEGVPPAEISDRLCITVKTTATHIEHILGKLGAHSQAQAVAYAIRDHLVDAAA